MIFLRIWALRILLFIGTCIVVIGLIEGVLQIASLFVGQRQIHDPGQADGHTILCLGDSHTYGVKLGEEDSYPGQLQTLLDARAKGRYRILNFGLPGTNSSEIRASLSDRLVKYRPKTLILLAGINNYWNISESEEQSNVSKVMQHFRLYRLLKLTLLGFEDKPADAEVFTGRPEIKRIVKDIEVEHLDAKTGRPLIKHAKLLNEEGEPILREIEEAQLILRNDLEAIQTKAKKYKTRLILQTYAPCPIPDHPITNRFTRHGLISDKIVEFGKKHGVPVVDNRPTFIELLKSGVDRKELFLSDKDGHPNKKGYSYMAKLLVDLIEPKTEGPIKRDTDTKGNND